MKNLRLPLAIFSLNARVAAFLLFLSFLPLSAQGANIPHRLDFRCQLKIFDTDPASSPLVEKSFESNYHDGAVGEQTTIDAIVRIHDVDWDLGIQSRWNKQRITFVKPGAAGVLNEYYESTSSIQPGEPFTLMVQPPQGGTASFSNLQVKCISKKR